MPTSRQRRFRAVILTLIAIFLVWEVITRSFVAYLADVAPETALQLRPTDSVALSNLAEIRLALDQSSKTSDVKSPRDMAVARGTSPQIAAGAKSAILGNPLDARAFRVLAQLPDYPSDTAGSEGAIQAC